MEMINTGDLHDVTDFQGMTCTLEGDLISFKSKVDGKEYRFVMDAKDAFSAGTWPIAAFKTCCVLQRTPIEQKSQPQYESLMRNMLTETMKTLESHLRDTLKSTPQPSGEGSDVTVRN